EPRALLRLEPRGVRGAEVFPGRRGPPEGAPLRLRHDEVVRRTSVPLLCGPISLPPDQVRHLPLLKRVRQRERPPRAGDPEVRGESGEVPQVARLQAEGYPGGRAKAPPGPNVVIRHQDGGVRRQNGPDRGLKGLADSTSFLGRPRSYRILLICL